MPNSVLYVLQNYLQQRKTLGSRLIESFIYFKLADQHAYSPMHDKKALSPKAQIQFLFNFPIKNNLGCITKTSYL